jgi:hypothetical protein
MEWDKNKITGNRLMQLFINDWQINAACRTNVRYVENKGREWRLIMHRKNNKPLT